MFIDTHCHLNLLAKKDFDISLTNNQIENLKSILNDSMQNKVEYILTVGTSVIESQNCINISKRFHNVYSVVGIHPCDCTINWKNDFEKIKEFLQNKKNNKIVAIGETGLDFYHKPYDRERQILAFQEHINLAIKNDLPIVVHIRDSVDAAYEVLSDFKGKAKGVIHCFSENNKYAKLFLDLGFYLGFGGTITYPKNNELREVVKYAPLDRILLETDAPFLPPQEFRGKTNYPKYIPIFANMISELKKTNISIVEDKTTKNAKRLFGI